MNAPAVPSTFSRRLQNSWLLGGLAVFFTFMTIQSVAKIKDGLRPDSQSAFQRWTIHLRQLDSGVNIWKEHNWPNTPLMAMILKPYANIDPIIVGSTLWLLTKALCTIAAIYLVFAMLDRPEHPFPFWGKVLTILLAIRPIEGDLIHGNVNLFILLSVVLAAYALTRGWDLTAGLSLSLGIACKITPALFLPYLVWKRAWKALAASIVGLGLWLFLVPSCYFGWGHNVECLHSWVNGMVLPYVEKFEITSEHQNQSLPGFLERMLRHRPSITRPNEERNDLVPVAYHNVADLPHETLTYIVKGCMAGFCLFVIWRCRAPRNDRTDLRWVAEFGAITLGMLIFNERTWKHHAVTLLIPFAVLAHQLTALRLSRGMRWYLTGTLTLVVALMLSTTSGLVTLFGVPDSHDMFGKYAQIYGAYLWSFFLLLGAMFTLSGQSQKAQARVAVVPDEPKRLAA